MWVMRVVGEMSLGRGVIKYEEEGNRVLIHMGICVVLILVYVDGSSSLYKYYVPPGYL